jgi:hypothetical protein
LVYLGLFENFKFWDKQYEIKNFSKLQNSKPHQEL